ncbi:M48 family metallopeptidase [Vitreimonas flagellata]|uniref:M48 family metallopeptidase n=1 Tax=Vitreimonas flagellata TaxID=2560861 RepID=UPI001074F3FC|nr:M48 family metallopeptidase [Vitreimonas flagellata]
MILARYADGRAAVTHDAQVELGPDSLTIQVGDQAHVWVYAELRRADDGSGRIMLKRKPDTGERLMLEQSSDLQSAAPELFKPRAFGIEGRVVVGGLVTAAWSIAAIFLIGIPLAAAPIADMIPERQRNQIADISWSQVNAFTDYCDDSDEAARILNDVAYRMMERSNVARRDDIWITIVDAPFPNAFALPDYSIIVTDDLIEMAESPDEVTGVIAHEIAHIEHNHVMKNIIRNVGAGVFFDIVFGGAGAGQAIAIASVNLTGLRYSRDDETDADLRGFEYMDAAGIDTGGVARLFARFTEMAEEQGGGDIPTLLSSHPASAERAATARARSRPGLAPSISDADWRIVRAACGGLEDEPAEIPPTETPESDETPPTPPAPAPTNPTPPLDGGAGKPEGPGPMPKPADAKAIAPRTGGLPSLSRAS